MGKYLSVGALSLVMLLSVAGCSENSDKSDGDNEPAKASADTPEVVVYSSRKEQLVKPLFDLYSEETGVKITYITDAAGPLIARLEAEGERTPADMLITVDVGNLWQAAHLGLLRPIQSKTLEEDVPDKFQDSEHRWFGLSVRARTIVYSTERVKPEELSTYENLSTEDWNGRLCLRTSKKVYNQSLVATLIERHGIERTEEVVKGWVDNLATDVFADDTLLMQAIVAGQCDVGIVNSYYFGRMQAEDPEIPLKLFWANQEISGVHVNISGAGVTKYAKHPGEAQKLIEWLSRGEAQRIFGGVNMEFPVNPAVPVNDLVKSWGDFKADQLPVEVAGQRQGEAIKLMDRAGYR
ncbi:MAG: extracellular solute-binding protein [Ketobacter sp.]